MVVAYIFLIGLCLGSFVNALVWRLHKQLTAKKQISKEYSISRGRSMCVNCGHKLGFMDLIPVLSWLSLYGRCRYCKKRISPQYPIVELITAILFMTSYVFWPKDITGLEIAVFTSWLVLLVGFMALAVYDFKWMLLPNKIVFPLYLAGLVFAGARLFQADSWTTFFFEVASATLIGGGIFWVLYQISRGKWIGGGDVKIGFLLGLLSGTPVSAMLLLFFASLLGTVYSAPTLIGGGRARGSAKIPFGPFLLVGCYIAVVFGQRIVDWYLSLTLGV